MDMDVTIKEALMLSDMILNDIIRKDTLKAFIMMRWYMAYMKTEIYIATHKDYSFQQKKIPIHVGKDLTDLNLGIIGDNTGDNISSLNPNFCELTALYWMWKNSSADYLGLIHYRRFA